MFKIQYTDKQRNQETKKSNFIRKLIVINAFFLSISLCDSSFLIDHFHHYTLQRWISNTMGQLEREDSPADYHRIDWEKVAWHLSSLGTMNRLRFADRKHILPSSRTRSAPGCLSDHPPSMQIPCFEMFRCMHSINKISFCANAWQLIVCIYAYFIRTNLSSFSNWNGQIEYFSPTTETESSDFD